MGEPARKYEDIQPDIRPNFNVIQGGGKTTPGRASLKVLNGLESNPEKSNKGSILDQEANGSNLASGSWKNDVTSAVKMAADLKKGKINLKDLKGKGPSAIIILIICFITLIVVSFSSSSLSIVHIKETLTEKFNYQLTSMDLRTNLILKSKVQGTTKGMCGTINILCKYSTMSDKQLAKFKKAGIEVEPEGTSLTGRNKVTKFTFNGEEIGPKDFMTKYLNNTEFRSAVKEAYNPKFAGFSDSAWTKAASALKNLSKKAAPLDGDDYDEKLKNLDDTITKETKLKEQPKVSTSDTDPQTGTNYTQPKVDEINASIDDANKLLDEAGEGSIISKLGSGAGEVANVVKISGIADDACTAYRTFRAIGYAAKTVRVIALAHYAMTILNVADQIKAGTAKDSDVEFIGKLLTDQTTDENGNLTSATDSSGYKYAAYNEVGNMPMSAMQYMSAAGLSGIMINFFEAFPGATKATCAFLGNPIVGGVSFLAGIGLMFTGVGEVNSAGQISLKASMVAVKKMIGSGLKSLAKDPKFWATSGLAFAEVYLPDLLKDIIAGTVINNTTVGANAGDALTSGAAVIMGTTAKYGGNAPLTTDQAVAYNNLSKQVAKQYTEEDQITYNPFDPTNSNTFTGKIVATLVPYISKLSSLSGSISSVLSLVNKTFASVISPNIKADSSISDYSTCQDTDYRNLNLATDPFCNIVYGLPTEDLSIDPNDVAQYLLDNNQIDSSGNITGDNYKSFISNCINRTSPLGYDEDGTDDGSECRTNDTNKYYYLYYIDQRVLTGMES